MKITPLLDEKVNIYDSEMPKETIESYEKYYKNPNECDTACDNEKELDCDGANKTDERIRNDLSNDATEKMTVTEENDCDDVNKVDERVGNYLSNDTTQKMAVIEKYDCDGVNKADEGVGNDLSNDTTQKMTVSEKCDNSNDSENKDTDRKRIRNAETASEVLPCKKRKKEFEPPKLREDNRDIFCWRCHKYVVETDVIPCYFCPRVFHLKCVHIHIQEKPSGFWLCTECDAISAAENPDKISPALSKLQKKDLAELLMFVLKRMRQHEGSSHYENPVDLESYPDYKDYIVKPMYLTMLENNVKNLKYSSCESFLADTKWMVHNSYVFNTVHSELTLYAKAMMKNAKHECDEIMNCPDCYLHANTLEDDKWFIEPCDKPHVLVWARLKGFPYWPCKVMKANGNNVDVRFFGDHNKSIVPVECCYLYSKQMPSKQKKVDELEVAIKEANRHIKRLEERFHVFQYAPLKTMYNPKEEEEQRKLLLPYYDKPFFIKVKDREKLFDPNVINNIFDDPLSFHKADLKEESKTNPISESPNALEIKNKKIILKPHNEELSPYRLSSTLNIKSMKSPPCNKPTIIIEDTDSDVLSQNSLNHSKQPIVISCEKFSSPCYSNKATLMVVNDKHINGALSITHMDHDHDNSMLDITKDSNRTQNNNNFKNKKVVTSHSTKERDNAIDDNQIDLIRDDNVLSENTKIDDKHVCFTSEEANCLPLTNPSLDKYNNNHSSDKLRINYNAKLINILNDNPALINNLFKPMVVIKKLDDQILLGYSNIKRKNEITAADKKSKSSENRSSNISSSDNGNNATLNFDLLNGNLNEFVSLTEIDLDKDESLSQTCLTNSKETEAVIKSEKMDDDEQVDNDYIERLSKSILDSTLDYNDVHRVEENTVFCPDIKNGSYERILVVDRENQAVKKDESITRSNNSSNQNSPNQVIDLEIIEGIEELDTQKSNGLTKSIISNDVSVVDQIRLKSDLNNKAIYLCEKKGRFQDQNMFSSTENEEEISLNLTNEIKSNEANKTVFTHSVENKKIIIENGKISDSDDIEIIDSNKKCQRRVFEITNNDILLQNEEKKCYMRDNSEIESCSSIPSDNSIIKETEIHCTAKENDSILEKNAKGLKRDSDCEIVKIVLPSNSKILKPIGFKRVKTSGGVIKKVIKNGMLVAAARGRQHLNIFSKENGVDMKKLCSKARLDDQSPKQLNNHAKVVKTYPASSRRPTCIKGPIDLKNVLENCADKMVSGTERVREEDKVMNLEINAILNKVEKIEAKGELLDVLREELEKFEEHCKSKIESYKNAYIEEMDSLYTMEKQRWIQETMNVSENESKMMVDEIKKKQWCILCLNEAKFHCCWSTSYCSEKCQLADWPVHMKTCTQYSMRIGDPDLRLSPELKKIFKGEQDLLNKKIKDILQSDKFMGNTTKISSSSPSCSCSSVVNSSEVASKNSIHTSPKSSTVYVQKNVSKQDTSWGSENHGNQVMKIVSNQAVYLSGMAVPPNQTKSLLLKQNPAKPNALLQDQTSTEMSGNNKHVLFTVPLANRNRTSAQTSIEKTSTPNKPSGNSLSSHNSPMIMGGQPFILPKSFLPTKVIKKTVPLIAHKNVNCVQDNNNSAFTNAKPLYISMQNISKVNSESSDERLRDPLEMTSETRLHKEKPKLLSERNSSSSNRDTNNKPQSFLIVEKSGETAQYTYKIGFKEDIEKMTQANLISPFGKKSTVCAVQPLSYPVVCNPSSSTENSSSTRMKN